MAQVIDAEIKTVEVYRSREDIRVLTADAGDPVDGADVVPGWKPGLAEIFAQNLEKFWTTNGTCDGPSR